LLLFVRITIAQICTLHCGTLLHSWLWGTLAFMTMEHFCTRDWGTYVCILERGTLTCTPDGGTRLYSWLWDMFCTLDCGTCLDSGLLGTSHSDNELVRSLTTKHALPIGCVEHSSFWLRWPSAYLEPWDTFAFLSSGRICSFHVRIHACGAHSPLVITEQRSSINTENKIYSYTDRVQILKTLSVVMESAAKKRPEPTGGGNLAKMWPYASNISSH